ncbi:zinc-binding dehydrogenase [Paenibacillus sp. SI8]|uniref:zinc-binding dehydrogenase n=1 Tax=unclassified Paenibacillus TaxID=185978 RepID=UPI00346566E0
MKAVVFDELGSFADNLATLRLTDVPIPKLGDNDVLVRMVAASINPGDFLFIQGLYPEPKKPTFPGQIAGNHGAGIIAGVGKNVEMKEGTFVHFNYFNTWAEYTVLPAEWVIPLPEDYPIEKASQFSNIVTAWDLLEQSKVQAGGWLAVTAGNSTLATLVSQLAAQRGVKVVSIVRNKYDHLDLRALGAVQVLELSSLTTGVAEKLLEMTVGNGLNGAIDCVGGPLAGELVQSLALGGQLVIYGGFSESKFELHNFDLLMKAAAISSYAYRYFFVPPKAEHMKLMAKIAEASRGPELKIQVGGFHPLEDFQTAVFKSLHDTDQGKRFIKM